MKAASVLQNLLSKTGSTWATRKDFVEALRKHGMNLSAIEGDKTIVSYNGLYSTKRIDEQENEIAVNVLRLLLCSTPLNIDEEKIDALIDKFEVEENGGYRLHYHQKDGVKMVVKYGFSILTGGPGTGKTTVLSCITYVLRAIKRDASIKYTAPTGKAARRISESTGEYASTTYKEFGITPDSKVANDFEGDVLFVDESSMNDNEIMSIFIRACQTGVKVCLVGDIDQLPSVGLGACLRDLIVSDTVPVTMLTHTFRQDNNSQLFANIINIRNGSAEIVTGDDYHAIEIPNLRDEKAEEKLAMDKLKEVYMEQVEKYGPENVVVLVPYRRSLLCSNWVNIEIQKLINKITVGYRYTNEEENCTFFFKKNDFVMQLKNREECANGDVGQIIDVSADGVTVQYVDCQVHYYPEELYQLTLAYAMSIHKSQGSEYPSVIMVLLNEHKAMLQRNLLYTGVTRAKKECTVIYQKEAYAQAVATIADNNRITLLKEKLKKVRQTYQMAYGI